MERGTEVLCARMSSWVCRKVRRIAQTKGVTVSEYILRAVQAKIDKQDNWCDMKDFTMTERETVYFSIGGKLIKATYEVVNEGKE